jgi:hypothetical protein
VTGSLSAKRFDTLSSEYEDGEKAGKFIEIVRKYTNFTELTPAMLNEFVEKILVHEAEGERKGYGRVQKVEIFLNFIGKLNAPGYEEHLREKREYHRKYQREWQCRRKKRKT